MVRERGKYPFLGTRVIERKNEDGSPVYGKYNWMTTAQVDEECQNFAKGLLTMGLCPQVQGENRNWNFLGIWAKNRWEWTASLLATMHYSITTVGFYDAMGVEQVEYILNQTEMTTVVCARAYAEKIITMKSEGMAQFITDLILMEGEPFEDLLVRASDQGIRLHGWT